MSLASISVEKRTLTWFATFLILLAGLFSFTNLGQLEDPEFAVKTAVVMTPYPGASAAEVELEVTDRIELALQEMPQLKNVYSCSRAGLSIVKVDIRAQYTAKDLDQVWDVLRKKVGDAQPGLPPGVGTPEVSDDFGDVYGFLMAITADGFSYAELEKYADHIKKELSVVKGVSRAELWGVQQESIYIEVQQSKLATLGLNIEDVYNTLTSQNVVVDAGGVDIQSERLRVQVTGEFSDPEEISNLIVRGRAEQTGNEVRDLTRIRDIAEIRRGYVEPSTTIMRFNGEMALGMSLSNVSGVNVVELGGNIDKRLEELIADLPVGIEVHRISWQSDLVDDSIVGFMINLAEAVAIVLAVLWLVIGFRSALVVGLCGLVFTIIATFLFMNLFGIDLQRMSLGALVISMGMMVDNAIVVADGMLVRLQRGMDKTKAAIESATMPSIPLLGATVIAVMTFYPIAASDESAGEYCVSLFYVVGIALILSWVLAVTITPLMCIGFIKIPKKSDTGGGEYDGRMYRVFAKMLHFSLRRRWIVLLTFVGVLGMAGFSFKWVDQMFFPAAARNQFMVDYWAPEGTRIQQTSEDMRQLEKRFLEDDRVAGVSTFIGQGPPRFYLPVDPEDPYSSYGQFIINTNNYKDVQALIDELQPWADKNVPQARLITRKYGLGPYESWPVEVRFSGPAIADPEVLRDLADKASAVMQESSEALIVRTDWRNRVKKLVYDYDQVNARWTSVTRGDIADASRRAYDGLNVGQYREADKLLPIMLRHNDAERERFADDIGGLQIRPGMAGQSVPLSQVTTGIETEWEDPIIWRWDRRRAITVQAVPKSLATSLRQDVIDRIEAIELPSGYSMEWDGEFRSSMDAQQSLIPGMIPAAVIVLLIIVALFNACRPLLVILTVIPFVLIGITFGLLITGQPFGFVALLGAMSLVGMMIKNAIVLLDQMALELKDGKPPYQAVVDSAVSRLRPVLLAAGTTILGVLPLLQDVFWISMAVTIMFGLAVGTFLTMILIPVLYCIFYRIPSPAK
jgi:multidrug efflux pump subunit AcrB